MTATLPVRYAVGATRSQSPVNVTGARNVSDAKQGAKDFCTSIRTASRACRGFMLSGARLTGVGLMVKGQARPVVTRFEERAGPRRPYFAFLHKAIEGMVHTGRPACPVGRTLPTSGILDRALTSRSQGGKRLEAPEMAVAYRRPTTPTPPKPDLPAPPTK